MIDVLTLAIARSLARGDHSTADALAKLSPESAKQHLGERSFADRVHVNTANMPRVSVAGEDGKVLANLMKDSIRETGRTMNEIVRESIHGYESGDLLSAEALDQLTETLATINTTADLLGRSRVRELAASGPPGVKTFADSVPFGIVGDSIPVFRTPHEALDYFLSLIPELGIDPRRYLGEQRRRAFTLAASTNRLLTEKVQAEISAGLGNNLSTRKITESIEDRMREFGAMGRNPQYAEMVARTNLNDYYTTGIYEEGRDPEIRSLFPVWEYMGIRDNRTGEDHYPLIGRYYPSDVTFADARGPRPWNCRCSLRWIDHLTWTGLQSRGARLWLK